MSGFCGVLVLLGLATLQASGGQPFLSSLGEPFRGKDIGIVWKITNQFPTTLQVFTSTKTWFSKEVVSNVVQLAEFKEPQKALAALEPVIKGSPVVFEEAESRKSVTINPSNGWIDLLNQNATAMPGTPVEEVPSESEALALTRKLLPLLGIQEETLAHKQGSQELEAFRVVEEMQVLDKEQARRVKKVVLRGVILFRNLNGISLSGIGDCGGVRAEFGNHATIKELALSWRNIKPMRNGPVADSGEIVRRIHSGEAFISVPPDLPETRPIKTLTIINSRLYYFGNSGEDAQKYVFPYVMLNAIADMDYTNVPVILNCTILRR